MNACHPNIQETEAGEHRNSMGYGEQTKSDRKRRTKIRTSLKSQKNPRSTFKAIIKDILLTDHQNLDI